MRKSTLVVLGILVASMVLLTVLYRMYMEQYVVEGQQAKALSSTLRADLEPEGKIRIGRVRGGAAYVVRDPERWGIVLFARPNEALWKADPSGALFGRRAALAVFEAYGADRPVDWVELRLTRPDGTAPSPFGFARGEGRQLAPLKPAEDPAPTGPTAPR